MDCIRLRLLHHIHRIYLACALAILLSSALASSSLAAHLTADYEPLQPGTRSAYGYDGLQDPSDVEFYAVQSGSHDVSGVATTVVKTEGGTHDGTLTYFTNDAQGLRVHGMMIPDPVGDDDLDVVYSTPIVILGPIFDVNSTFHSSADATNLGKAKLTLHIEHDVTVEEFETLNSPIGQLDTVQLLRVMTVSYTCPPGDTCPEDELRQARQWYARGLGMVATETCDNKRNNPSRCAASFFTENDPANTPDHSQIVLYTEKKTYLPEPAFSVQALTGIFGLMALHRRRMRG
jgi:hypothetical protein